MQHRKAPEIEGVAREVMSEHHAMLDQRGPRVEWVMVKPEQPSGSAPDWKIRKVNGVHAYLALPERERPTDWGLQNGNPVRAFIAVEISEGFWQILDEGQREALCDHVCAHLQYDYEKGNWRVEGPEFGEFEDVLERRGFWRPDKRLRRFAEGMAEQLSLLEEDPAEGGESGADYDHDGEDGQPSLTEHGPNGELVDAGTGEVLEPAGARS